MRRYQLWLDCFSDVEKYVMEYLKLSKIQQERFSIKRRYKACDCLKFLVDGHVRNRFTISEIDSLIAGYKSEEEFLSVAHSTGNRYLRGSSHPLIATYQYGGELRQMNLIYQSPLLQKYALIVRKNQRTTKLPDSVELDQFCLKLLRMVEDFDTRNYVLSPFAVPNILYEDAKELTDFLPRARNFQSQQLNVYQCIYYNDLYQSLSNYAKHFDQKEEKIRMGFPTSQEEEMLIADQKGVLSVLKKDYMTLRNAISFMKVYERVISRKEKVEEESMEQFQFFAGENKELFVVDPYLHQMRQEQIETEIENADILRRYAQEDQKKWNEKYFGEEDDTLDSYAFEENDMDTDFMYIKDKGSK